MSAIKIHLQQSQNDDNLYIVDTLTNTIEPIAGSVLTHKVVEELIATTRRKGGSVTIKRGNAK